MRKFLLSVCTVNNVFCINPLSEQNNSRNASSSLHISNAANSSNSLLSLNSRAISQPVFSNALHNPLASQDGSSNLHHANNNQPNLSRRSSISSASASISSAINSNISSKAIVQSDIKQRNLLMQDQESKITQKSAQNAKSDRRLVSFIEETDDISYSNNFSLRNTNIELVASSSTTSLSSFSVDNTPVHSRSGSFIFSSGSVSPSASLNGSLNASSNISFNASTTSNPSVQSIRMQLLENLHASMSGSSSQVQVVQSAFEGRKPSASLINTDATVALNKNDHGAIKVLQQFTGSGVFVGSQVASIRDSSDKMAVRISDAVQEFKAVVNETAMQKLKRLHREIENLHEISLNEANKRKLNQYANEIIEKEQQLVAVQAECAKQTLEKLKSAQQKDKNLSGSRGFDEGTNISRIVALQVFVLAVQKINEDLERNRSNKLIISEDQYMKTHSAHMASFERANQAIGIAKRRV